MKIPALKKRINRNLALSGIFTIIFGFSFYQFANQKNIVKTKVDAIGEETSKINLELSDLQSKTVEIKKYKELWPTIPESKKNTSGVKVDDVTARINSIAKKYGITNPTLRISVPELIKGGVFDLKTANVMIMTASINFSAPNDVKAVMFVSDFIESLKGYPIVTNFSIIKNKEYTGEELIELSTGKSSGLITSKIDFYWYIYRDLEKKPEGDQENQVTEEKPINKEAEVLDEQKPTP
ncbi:MAG: hypothetical protein KGP29_00635 [Proteobacteria bacterium]|nr:hypothetical protein [Pseudomonadota bacterium]